MRAAKILLVESERTTAPSFAPALEKKGYAVSVEHSTKAVIKHVQQLTPDIVILDAASLKTSGTRLVKRIKDLVNGTPILLVAGKKSAVDEKSGAAMTLVQPFTARKLLNGVARLLPGDDSLSLQVGPIKLNLAQRRISCGGREQRVTPKQAKLCEVFLRSPGQLLTRKYLIKHVWETDYTGDTRTLDVHMSWLRRVIEPNPQKPRYLKTIRGLGYRLDLPDSAVQK